MLCSRRRIWLWRFLLTFGLVLALWLGTSCIVVQRLTRRAGPMVAEHLPTVLRGKAESVRLRTSDGINLGAWFLPGRSGSPLVLLLHGNGGSRSACLEQAQLVHEIGCPVLLVTQRAHGDSTGEANDFGYGARHDVVAGVTWLAQQAPGRPILIWGQSLGSAAALFALTELEQPIAGFILECPYRDLRTAVRHRTQHYLPWGLDHAAYTGLILVAPFFLPDFERISPLQAASHMPRETPVLILAGGADRRARPEEAQAIAGQLGQARVVVFEGADHLQLSNSEPDRYRETVTNFLKPFSSTE
jgi:alpha-beta hydrolase superfamily lysophospholipase